MGSRKGSTSSSFYRSEFEKRIGEMLLASRGEGLLRSLVYEPTQLLYVVERTYTPDFSVLPLRGDEFFVEVKGYFSSADRAKLLAVREQNPGVDIRLVFQRAGNRLSSRSKTTYAQWADKHGFLWAEGQVPATWMKGEE